MANREKFGHIISSLFMLYPRFKADDAKERASMVEAYYRILGDLPAELLDAAALEIGRSNTFFPSAAEWRGAALRLLELAKGVPTAESAWAEVARSFGTHGRYRGAPVWSHSLIGRAVEALGGYATLCVSESAMVDRAHFFKVFAVLLERWREERAMLPATRRVVERLTAGGVPALEIGDFG